MNDRCTVRLPVTLAEELLDPSNSGRDTWSIITDNRNGGKVPNDDRCTDDDMRAIADSNPDPRARSAAAELLAMRKAAPLMVHALDESVKLQAHYATLLNQHDGGEREVFASTEAWMARLDEVARRTGGRA